MKRKYITIALTQQQSAEFEEFFDKVEESSEAGKTGGIIAQIEWNDKLSIATVRAAFIDYETVKKVQDATGVNEK